MLLTSYMGTQAQAISSKRDYTGILGRADRLVFLMLAPVIQHVLNFYLIFELPLGLFLLEWVLIYFAFMGNVTALQRFYSTFMWLKKNK